MANRKSELRDELTRVQVRVTPAIHDFFRSRSDLTGISVSALMFLALEQHVQQHNTVMNIPEILERMRQAENPVVPLSP